MAGWRDGGMAGWRDGGPPDPGRPVAQTRLLFRRRSQPGVFLAAPGLAALQQGLGTRQVDAAVGATDHGLRRAGGGRVGRGARLGAGGGILAGGGHAAGDARHEQHADDDDDPEQQFAHVSLDAE
ncbi:hypothetical protein CV751_08640 [Achromobacter ruhlandii]|nr:hypothetical protein CV751_08640 [Achromobacter ruhlandii]